MNLGARTAAWSGEKLPYKKEVLYLESSGVQYINTGWVLPAKSVRMRIGFTRISATGREGMCGSQDNSSEAQWTFVLFPDYSTTDFCTFMRHTAHGATISCGNGDYRELDWLSNADGQFFTEKITGYSKAITGASGYQLSGGTEPVYLFQNTSAQRCAAKIHYCQIMEEDSLVRDLIPVIATFDGVDEPCFYNKAYTSDGMHGLQFYRNAGTGTFGYGELGED